MATENRPMVLAREAAEAVKGTLLVPRLSENDREQNVMPFGELLRHKNTRQVSKLLHEMVFSLALSLNKRKPPSITCLAQIDWKVSRLTSPQMG